MNLTTRISFSRFILIALILIVLFQCTGNVKELYSYYGFPNALTFSWLSSPLMSYRFLGIPFYNYSNNPYIIGGNYNLTSNLSGLYLGGIFNQPYGLGNIYGPNGAPGLYGMSSLYGLNALNLSSFGFHGLTFPGSLIPTSLTNPFFSAEQAGAWSGTWNLGFLTGTMIMNLQETITGSISGTAQLIGNLTFGGIFNVFGSADPAFISLNGQDPTLTYAVTLQGTLTTPGTMEGFYSIYKIGSTVPKETGTFNLELLI
jgi:hypothetical protein